MKGWRFPWLGVLAVFSWCGESTRGAERDREITKFVAAKEVYVERVARELNAKLPAEVGHIFDAARESNWRSVSNLFGKLENKYGPNVEESALPTELWYVMQEVGGSYEQFGYWDRKYVRIFADEIFKVVPADSVYFGGTDPGRFVITALSESHEHGKPFFTITQNQLAATPYLEYIQRIYGGKLKFPGTNDIRRIFDDYLKDAQGRLEHDRRFPNEPKQVKPGEEVKIVDGRVQVSGQMAVMEVNGRIVKHIFEANPDREFYIEESYPLDWMYPHLTPTGPIFKVNRKPVETLAGGVVAEDRSYWDTWLRRTVGLRITDETSVSDVCDLADRIHRQRSSKDFEGDQAFLKDTGAQKTFSKLRSATGGMYAWRAKSASSAPERRRMLKEADLAFKQAYCLWPATPEGVYRYTNLLIENDRKEEAYRFIQAASKFNPDDAHIKGLRRYVEDWVGKKERD